MAAYCRHRAVSAQPQRRSPPQRDDVDSLLCCTVQQRRAELDGLHILAAISKLIYCNNVPAYEREYLR